MRFHSTIPALPVQDIEAAVGFYTRKLGFSCCVQTRDFARIVRDEVAIDLWLAADETWSSRRDSATPVRSGAESFLAGTASCRIRVQDIDAIYQQYRAAGVLYGPDTVVERTSWGTREFAALDLERNLLTLEEQV